MPLPVLISFASIGAFAGSVVGQLLIGTALSAVGAALNKQNQPDSPGIRTEVTTEGSTTPQTFILGRYATAGNLVAPMYASGTPRGIPNGFRHALRDISDMPITAYRAIWIDGDRYGMDDLQAATDSNGITYLTPKTGDFVDALRIVFYDGTQTAADPLMLADFADHAERPWSADMIGRGVAYVRTTFRFDPELYQGEPSVLIEAEGIKLYDPRKDSTNGGTGAHRWGNSATWEFTENPAVMVYNLLRGLPLPDGGTYGLGVASDDLPAAWWHVAMDKCDELVGSNPRYRAGYEVKMATAEDGGDTPLDVIDELLKAMDGELCDLGGTWIIRAGAPLDPVASITDEDILRSSPQDLDPFKGLADTYNAVRASHPLPSSMWKATEAPPRYDEAAEAEDGQRLVADIDLPAVPYPVQVQRLMRAWLKDARRMRRHTIVLPPQYSYLTPLDTIEWSSDRNGYVTKLFEIGDVEIDALSLSVRVTLRERNPADYDWQPEYELPTEAPSQVIVPYTRVPLPGFQVSAVAIKDAGGTSRRAAIEMTWPGDLSADMRAIAWQVRLLAAGEVVNAGSMSDVAEGRVVVSEGILPSETYEVRARGLRARTEWTAWISVTTLPAQYLTGNEAQRLIEAGEDARNAGRDAADNAREILRDVLSSQQARENIRGDVAIIAQEQTRRLIEGEEALVATRETLLAQIGENQAAIVSESVARATADEAIAATSTQLSARVDNNEAAIVTEQLARADQDSALAARIDTIEAEVDTNAASIVTEQVARADADSALATEITTLTATVDGNTAELSTQGAVVANLDGTLTASYLLRARAGGATGEMEVVAGSDPDGASSLVRFSADRFLFQDGIAMFGGALQSDNFVAGSTGWRIRQNGNVEFNNLISRGDIETDTLTRDLFADDVLQVPLYPIWVDYITSSDSNWAPFHDGLAQVIVIGAGGSGGYALDYDPRAAASGGGGGGCAVSFIPNISKSDRYNIKVGAGGAAAVGTSSSERTLAGNNGGQSYFKNHGLNLVANGGKAGSAVRGASNITAAQADGGTASGGIYNYTGGYAASVTITGSDQLLATGGGAFDIGLRGIQDASGISGGTTAPSVMPTSAEVSGFMLNGYDDFSGGNGFGGANGSGNPGGTGCGGGGCASNSYFNNQSSGAGGDGLVVVIYYGAGSLK